MPKFQAKSAYLTPDQDAPDPVEFARAAQGLEAPPDVGDPTVPIPAGPGGDPMAHALVMIAEALKTIKAGDAGAAQRLAGIESFLLRQEETRPHENLFNPPMISALNPLGERDHPRPDLQCRMIWVGYELSKETLSRQEIELLNRLQPGDYWVTKADQKRIRFNVAEKITDGGQREMLTVHFPCKGKENSQNHASLVAYVQEVLGERPDSDMLLTQIEKLKVQLAAAQRASA